MTMTLEQVLQASAAEIEFLATKDQLNVTDHDRHLRLLASLRNAITHLTQPAQSVDVEKVTTELERANALLRECYEWLFESLSDGPRVSEGAIEKGYYTPQFAALHIRLQAILQGTGE